MSVAGARCCRQVWELNSKRMSEFSTQDQMFDPICDVILDFLMTSTMGFDRCLSGKVCQEEGVVHKTINLDLNVSVSNVINSI